MAIRTVYKSGEFKVCYDSDWQEYCVGLASVPNGVLIDHSASYCTDDKADAIDTCNAMAEIQSKLEVTP